MPDRATIEALVETYTAAVGRQDVAAAVACFAADAVQEDPVGSPPNEGADAIRGFFERSFQMAFTVTPVGSPVIGNGFASFRFTIEVPTGGDPMVIQVADLARVGDDGLFSHVWAVQDLGGA